MREEHTSRPDTTPPLQVKANSLFHNILPPSPFASRFWHILPISPARNSLKTAILSEPRQKKDEICPLLVSEPGKVVEGRTDASPRDFARCKLIKVISDLSSSKGIYAPWQR